MNVLLIGATSAIAAATAERMAVRGDRLYLVGRDPDKMQQLRDHLGPAVVSDERLDLTDPAQHVPLVARARERLGAIDIALVCHGWLPDQIQTERDWEITARTFEINLLSVVSLLMVLANDMEPHRTGTIGVITSVAGMRGRPRNFTYGAAKGALSIYLQGLRSRLWPSGVKVCDLRPGPVFSPMTEGHPPNRLFATPDRVAAGILLALDRGFAVKYLPWYWGPILRVVMWLPEPVFQRIPSLAGR